MKRYIVLPAIVLLSGSALGQSVFENDPSKQAVTPSTPVVAPAPVAPVPVVPPAATTTDPVVEPKPVAPVVPVVAKAALPSDADLKAAQKLVADVYQKEIAGAKTADAKRALARKLLDLSKEETGTNKYALLIEAKEIAIEAGDVEDCTIMVDALEGAFSVDSLKVRTEICGALSRTVRLAADRRKLAEMLSATMRAGIAADRFDMSKIAVDAEQVNAQALSEPATTRMAVRDMQLQKETEGAFAEIKSALATLVTTPTDAESNFKVGKYRCYMKADWKTGLPMLAIGNDAKLKPLAVREVAGLTAANDQVEVGDGWWEIGDKLTGIAKINVLNHAAELYRAALPTMSKGLVKAKVEQRVASLEVTPTDTSVIKPVTPTTPTTPVKPVVTANPKPYVGTWLSRGGGDYTLNADGTLSRHDGNTGKWTSNAQGTAIELIWDGGGYTDVFQREGNRWVKSSYRGGVYKSSEQINPPAAP